ncbi:MAG: C10 family peptidase [Bacteroidales bacterium]
MKKIFTTFLLLIFAIIVFADPVTKNEAQAIAEKFFTNKASKGLSEIKIINVFEQKYKNETSFYIFSFDKGGFVIVSADDLAYPILGYSTTSKTKEYIDNTTILHYFNRFEKQIELLKKQKNTSPEIQKLWVDYRNGIFPKSIKAVAPLLTSTWNQSPYYNQLCPTGTPTGCVATAMSQIMNYHEWPSAGNGWHKYIPSGNPSYGEQYADFQSATYDWDNMPNELISSSTDVQKNAVATLCYHAGVSVDMNYDPDGSGAISTDVLYALTSYFKYDPTSIQIYGFNVANIDEWLVLAKNELDNGRPIYYDGSSSANGGHAWVCDGYDASDNLHINWGWGGYYNGYYAANAMNPSTMEFDESNSMIIGIKPGSIVQDILWTKQASGFITPSRGIQFISAIDKKTAWAVAYDGSGNGEKVKDFTRTIDGGANWISGTINTANTTDYTAAMISAIDNNTAWVALFGPSGGGKIVKTADGGTTWVHQSTATFSAPNGFPNVVHFWDANNGFCMGDPNSGYFEIYTTTNGGDTWTRVPQANIPANLTDEYGTVGYYTVVGDIVWFATNKGRIYKSVNKGLNWVVYQTPITNTSFELSFKDSNIGIIQRRGDGDNKVQYITTNGGENWTALTPTGNFYTTGFTFVPGSDLLISTGVDYETPFMGVSYSMDNGTTFHDYAEFYKNHQFSAIGAASIDAIWAGGFSSDQYTNGMWHYGDVLKDFDISVNNRKYCANDSSVIFTDESIEIFDSWNWHFGDGALPETAIGKGPHTVKYTTGGSKNIKLVYTKDAVEDSIIKNDFVHISTSLGSLGTITGVTSINVFDTQTYSLPLIEETSYSWDIPADWSSSSSKNTAKITPLTQSTETITVTPSNTCGDGTPSTLEITSVCQPLSSLGVITGDASVMTGETFNYSVVAQNYVSYNWEIPTEWSGSSTTNSISITFTGSPITDTIRVTPSNTCGEGPASELEIIVSLNTGFDDINSLNGIAVYPNPAKEIISISNIKNAQISIYNTAGIMVYRKENINSDIPVNITGLMNGTYYIKILDDNKSVIQLLTIAR